MLAAHSSAYVGSVDSVVQMLWSSKLACLVSSCLGEACVDACTPQRLPGDTLHSSIESQYLLPGYHTPSYTSAPCLHVK